MSYSDDHKVEFSWNDPVFSPQVSDDVGIYEIRCFFCGRVEVSYRVSKHCAAKMFYLRGWRHVDGVCLCFKCAPEVRLPVLKTCT